MNIIRNGHMLNGTRANTRVSFSQQNLRSHRRRH